MLLIVVLIVFGALSIAGTARAVAEAASPEATTARRIELSILAGLLGLFTLFIALVGYWLWQFARSVTY